jgi:hypothetical protein
MATRSKRVKVFRTEIDKTKFINATEAFDLLKKYLYQALWGLE